MPRSLIILGTGGSAFDALDIIEAINALSPTWEVSGFLDDARPTGSRHLGLEILGRLGDAPKYSQRAFINVIGSDKSFRQRPAIIASTGLTPDRFASLVHPQASVSSRARLGRGVIVNAGVVVGGAVSIGDHVMIGPRCVVGHETTIGDYSILAPGAIISGLVDIGSTCYIGAGAAIRQRLRIGEGALIGMGAVAISAANPGSTSIGNPARERPTAP